MSSNVPAPDTLSGAILTTLKTIQATKSVQIQKENFKKLSSYLEKTTFILQESTKFDIQDSGSLKTAITILTKHVSEAKTLALECTNKNKIYLLLNSKTIVTSLEKLTKEIGEALNLISPLVNGLCHEITKLSNIMLDSKYLQTSTEEDIKDKIELGIRERNVDRSYANSLLILIADAIGSSTEQSVLRKEYEDFKHEMENMDLTEDVAKATNMEQIVAILGKADIIATVVIA